MKRRKPNSDPYASREVPASDEQQTSSFCFGAAEMPACFQRELQNMPQESREQAGQDVYGFAEPLDIPEERIADLRVAMDRLENKAAYELALELDPEYAMSKKLAMAFLLSVEGNPKQAAKRLAKHFQTKLDLFGRERLVKDIEIIDLDDDDLEALYSGGYQILPQKDRAGRPILFGRYTAMRYKSVKNMVRRI